MPGIVALGLQNAIDMKSFKLILNLVLMSSGACSLAADLGREMDCLKDLRKISTTSSQVASIEGPFTQITENGKSRTKSLRFVVEPRFKIGTVKQDGKVLSLTTDKDSKKVWTVTIYKDDMSYECPLPPNLGAKSVVFTQFDLGASPTDARNTKLFVTERCGSSDCKEEKRKITFSETDPVSAVSGVVSAILGAVSQNPQLASDLNNPVEEARYQEKLKEIVKAKCNENLGKAALQRLHTEIRERLGSVKKFWDDRSKELDSTNKKTVDLEKAKYCKDPDNINCVSIAEHSDLLDKRADLIEESKRVPTANTVFLCLDAIAKDTELNTKKGQAFTTELKNFALNLKYENPCGPEPQEHGSGGAVAELPKSP